MAEKYGEIPKLFTKEWWEYFWDYYKLHTIVFAVIILVAVTTIWRIASAPRYEINALYAGEYDLSDESANLLSQKMTEFVTDSDGDGKDGVALNRIFFVNGVEDLKVEFSYIMKMQLELRDEDSLLFIFDDTKAQYYLGDPDMYGAFLEADQWLDGEIGEDRLYMSGDKCYAVSLKDSKLLEECGINSENLYIAVKNQLEEPDEELKEKIADAKNIANAIVE